MDKRFFGGQNLDEDFVGQGVTPILQMEVETAGLVCSSNGVWF